MNTQDFIDALQNPQFAQWITQNAQSFIGGGAAFQREVQLTNFLAGLMPANIQGNAGGYRDFHDQNNHNDVGENAHSGTYQSASFGPEHLIKRFNEYVSKGLTGQYFGLMSLLHFIQLNEPTQLGISYRNNLNTRTPAEVQAIFNQFPGGVQSYNHTQVISSEEEPDTQFQYHFYLVSFDINEQNAALLAGI
jgi:hypothetical protein